MNTNLKKALFLTTLGYLQANEGFLAIMPDENKQEDISQEQKLEHKMEQKIAPQNTLKKQQSVPLPKTNALKPLAFSYGDTRRNAFRRANME